MELMMLGWFKKFIGLGDEVSPSPSAPSPTPPPAFPTGAHHGGRRGGGSRHGRPHNGPYRPPNNVYITPQWYPYPSYPYPDSYDFLTATSIDAESGRDKTTILQEILKSIQNSNVSDDEKIRMIQQIVKIFAK